jgi:hypothetical protein
MEKDRIMDDEGMQSRYEHNAEYLRGHAGFAELPSRFRQLVLSSPNASSDFASFYADGGRVVGDPNESLASYRAEPQREIRINQAQLEFAKTLEGAHLVDGMFSTIAHEIGHDKDRGASFPRGSADEYVEFRSEKEARAIFNAFPIFADLAKSDPSFKPVWKDLGYSPMGLAWPPVYNQWRSGALDEAGAIKEMAESVADFPYTRRDGLTDHSGDGRLTQRDLYLHDYQGLLRGQDGGGRRPGAEPAESSAHPLLNGLEPKVKDALRHGGLTLTDSEVGSVTMSLAARSAQAGLGAVDHVVLGVPVASGERNIFAVHGELGFPGHHRTHVVLAEAVAMPTQDSLRALMAAQSQDRSVQDPRQDEIQRATVVRS